MMFERLFRPKTTRIELDLTDAQIVQLRAVMDGLPLVPYVGLVLAVVKKLPPGHESADCTPSVADARPAQTPSEPGRGFKLTPLTAKGRDRVAEVERLLARLPHGDSL